MFFSIEAIVWSFFPFLQIAGRAATVCSHLKNKMGTSLEVEWLRLHAFTARVQVQSLVGDLKSHIKKRNKKWKLISLHFCPLLSLIVHPVLSAFPPHLSFSFHVHCYCLFTLQGPMPLFQWQGGERLSRRELTLKSDIPWVDPRLRPFPPVSQVEYSPFPRNCGSSCQCDSIHLAEFL